MSALKTVLFRKIITLICGKIAEFLMLMQVKNNYGMWVLRLHSFHTVFPKSVDSCAFCENFLYSQTEDSPLYLNQNTSKSTAFVFDL
jgi:hypothetical protein